MAHDTLIGWRDQLSSETRPWSVDMSPAMDVGDSINSVTATLTDLLNGTDYAAGLLGSATVTSTTSVQQTVTGLVPGHNYKLELLANMGGSKRTSVVLNLAVPY